MRCAGAVALAAVSTAGLVLGLGSAAKAVPQVTSTQTTPAQSGKAQPSLSDPTGPVNVPICGDQDGSEIPLTLQCPTFTRVPEQQMLVVPGSLAIDLTFDYVYKAGLIAGEMYYFKVDDDLGSIGTLKPGDPGYLSAVYQRAAVLFPQGANASTPDRTLTLNGGDRLVFMYVTSNLDDLKTYNPSNSPSGTPYALFSLDALNPDGIDHVLAYTDNVSTSQFAFEDLLNGGDRDYDDVVFDVRGVAAPRFPLIVLPGITGSYLRSPYGEAWPSALAMATDPFDLFLDNLQLADDGVSPKDPSDPAYDISVWTDHGKQGIIDQLELGCVLDRCPHRIRVYSQTFDFLENHGYHENVNLFPFAFDWRKSATFNSTALLDKIDQVRAQTGASKVNILAHSQGGLVVEAALMNQRSVGKVSRVLTMGTPYLGATRALSLLDYGEPCPNEAFTICLLDPKEAQKLSTNFRGFLDLLPSRPFYGFAYPGPVNILLDRNGDGTQDGYLTFDAERANLTDRNLALIDQSTAFHDASDYWSPADPSVQLLRMAGSKIPTIRSVVEYKEEDCLDFYWWKDCQSSEKMRFALDTGDGTVPVHSADLWNPNTGFDDRGSGIDVWTKGIKHTELPQLDFTLEYAVNWLSLTGSAARTSRLLGRLSAEATSGTIDSQPTPLAGTEVVVNGHASGLVTDAAGNRIGQPAGGAGAELDEIPGAAFNQANGSGSFFVTDDGTYQGSWKATADGQVELVVRSYANDAISAVAAAPSIAVHAGAVLSLGFSSPASLGSLSVAVDDDGNGTVDRTVPFTPPVLGAAASDSTPPASQVTVQNFTNGAGQPMANVTITATDNAGGSGVDRIEYALDASDTSGVYTSQLTVPGTGKIIVRAIDRAGNVEAPYRVVRLSKTTALGGGSWHGLALNSDSSVWAWGQNTDGQLGDGTTTSSAALVKVKNLTGVTALGRGSGALHSLAVTSDGSVWAWGDNLRGELGNGTTTDSSVPVKVSSLTGATGVAAGDFFSLALKSDRTVWTWGENDNGQLGNGKTTNSSVPVKVSNLTGATAVTAGNEHSLALKSDGTVTAWGANPYGQLGNGKTTSSSTPVKVSNLTGATAVAAGEDYSLALKSDGTVWAWGSGFYGNLGNGSNTNSSVPVKVSNLTGATAIAAGNGFSLAVKSDGTVWAWGRNTYGQLGNGTITNSSVPVKVSNLTGASAVAAGWDQSLALKSDGTLWAWGSNSSLFSRVPVQVPG